MAAGWAALAGAANAYTQQRQTQQDDARWEERYQIMQRSQQDAEKARARYLLALKPPETEKINTVNAAGKPVVQTRQWVAPSDEDIAAGKQGQFNTVAETPDINFDRLDEQQRHNAESERLRAEATQARNDASAARLAMERERLNAAKGGGGGSGKLIRQVMPDGSAVYGLVQDGKFAPVQDEEGNPLNTTAWRPRAGKPGDGDAIGPPPGKVQPVFVDPSAQPMGQFDAPAKAAPVAAPKKAPPDGTVLYKNGRKYVVRGGVPVPAQ